MLTFEAPLHLFLLLLLIPGIYGRHYWKNRGGRLQFSFRVWGGKGFRPQQRGLKLALVFMYFLYWASLAVLILAMAGPTLVTRDRVYLTEGVDIMVILDESPSMSARDFPPENRFETAKSVIRRFVEGRENDSIGLVTFGKEAVLRVPPTMDYSSYKERLEALPLMTLGDGTAIGMGLAVAVLHLEKSGSPNKVIILLTDGANNLGEIQPRAASEIAREKGIRIYTVGLGSEGPVPVEFTDPATGKHYTGILNESFDETLLRDLASRTGGRFFHALSPRSLETIFEAIDSIEVVEKRFRVKVSHQSLYRYFLGAALGFFFLSGILRKWLWGEII